MLYKKDYEKQDKYDADLFVLRQLAPHVIKTAVNDIGKPEFEEDLREFFSENGAYWIYARALGLREGLLPPAWVEYVREKDAGIF